MNKPQALLLAAAATLMAAQAARADEPGVTPYRPSVSSPAQLPAAGQPELELGGQASNQQDGRRNSLPYALKYAFNPEWGVVLGGEAWVAAPDGQGGKARGVGDTSAVLKRAFAVSDGTALGLELGVKFPTSAASERKDYGLNGIWSQDLDGEFHLDANVNAVRLGAVGAGEGRVQRGASLALSHPLAESCDGVVEWSGTQRRGVNGTAQLLVAVSHSVTPRLVIDFGLARALTPATPRWSFFTGIVFPLAL